MIWSVPKIWNEGTCWIIGGGASLTSQFNIPKKIVEKVQTGELPISAYSPYMSLLHDKHVIAVNGAFRLGDWIDICFFGDKNWYFQNAKALNDYKGLLVGCPEFLQVQGWQNLGIKYLQKDHSKKFGISTDPSKVCWNNNSGSAAISIAYNTGCKRIVLLGFDMTLSPTGKGHWHNLYNGKTTMPFYKHLTGFEQIALDAKRLGIEIINASPDSKITQFPKMNIEEILPNMIYDFKHDFKPYPNEVFIETGSYVGDGIQAALDAGFKQVLSIELSPFYYEHCKKRFKGNKKVRLFLGSSIDVLPRLLKVINTPVTFWLDAHYSGGDTAKAKQDVPILEELEIIKYHVIKTHTILIDDIRLIGKDSLDWNKFTIQEVESLLGTINPDYKITYGFGITEYDILIAQA